MSGKEHLYINRKRFTQITTNTLTVLSIQTQVSGGVYNLKTILNMHYFSVVAFLFGCKIGLI